MTISCNKLDILQVFEKIIPNIRALPSQVRPQVSVTPSQVLTVWCSEYKLIFSFTTVIIY